MDLTAPPAMVLNHLREICNQENICKIMRTVFYFCKFSGIAPFRLITSRGGQVADVNYSIPAAIYSGLLAIIMLYGYTDIIIHMSNINVLNLDFKFNVLYKINIFMSAASAAVIIFVNLTFNYWHIKTLVTKAEQIENVAMTYYMKAIRIVDIKIILVIFSFFAFTGANIYRVLQLYTGYMFIAANVINLLVNFSFVIQRAIIIRAIVAKLKILNHTLGEMFDHTIITRVENVEVNHIKPEGNNVNEITELKFVKQFCSREIKSSARDTETQVRTLALIHHRLTDVTTKVNCMYGLTLLLDIFSTFVQIVTNVYFAIYIANGMRTPNDQFKNFGRFLTCTTWAVLNIAKSLLLIQFSNDARAESLDTVRIANELLLTKDLSVEDEKQLKKLASQVRRREVVFTATGFITLDYSFLSSMLGAVATYILVILQFEPE